MVAQYTQSQTVQKAKSNTAVFAVVTGLFIGTVIVVLSDFTGMVAVAMWPLGVAIGLMGASWWIYRQYEETNWGMAIAGQLLGALAIGLLFIASIA